MKSLLIILGALFVTSSAIAQPAKCTATAEVTNGHVIFHVDPKQCAKVLYTVGGELTSITIQGGYGGSDYLLSYYENPKAAVVSCTPC
jgi:hypothetical protein